ncbi:hypothetical protein HZH68_016208 [Vespula germanica]|uniref:Uncharacterized protein n=1 Tax=Vespula germanica TaxID=30212 RepID=A0A834MRJ6_VESGE|nr:hypothetical protein HZH68_016208 [Vespula germanica]
MLCLWNGFMMATRVFLSISGTLDLLTLAILKIWKARHLMKDRRNFIFYNIAHWIVKTEEWYKKQLENLTKE